MALWGSRTKNQEWIAETNPLAVDTVNLAASWEVQAGRETEDARTLKRTVVIANWRTTETQSSRRGLDTEKAVIPGRNADKGWDAKLHGAGKGVDSYEWRQRARER